MLGGEPLHQSGPLLELYLWAKEHGLSIVLFTGFELEEIEDPTQRRLLELSDIIINGRYVEERRNIYSQWKGSDNQQITFNGDRYKDYCLDDANYVEVDISECGEIAVSGFPTPEFLRWVKQL